MASSKPWIPRRLDPLLNHAGDAFSRDNIEAGMLSFPSSGAHGPHPKAPKNMLVQPKTAADAGHVDSWKAQ